MAKESSGLSLKGVLGALAGSGLRFHQSSPVQFTAQPHLGTGKDSLMGEVGGHELEGHNWLGCNQNPGILAHSPSACANHDNTLWPLGQDRWGLSVSSGPSKDT